MKKKNAILHAQIPFVRGGAEIMVNKLLENLELAGYDTELIKLPFRWYPENAFYDSMLIWDMLDLREINGQKIDLVIASKFPSYGIQHPNKVIWLMHQHRAAYDLEKNEIHGGLGTIPNGERMKAVVKRFDQLHITDAKKIYAISKNVGDRLKRYNGLMAETLYHPPGLIGKYKCEKYGDYILSVGRLDPLKRIDLLLKAISKIKKGGRAIIVGDGVASEELKKLSQELKIEDRIEFLGRVNDDQLIELYANAKAVYYAPVDEDYGYVTLEAFFSRKPIITCIDSGGVLEFAKDKTNAIVCETNEESIAKAIEMLYSDEKLPCNLGINGFESIKDISWKNVVEKLTITL